MKVLLLAALLSLVCVSLINSADYDGPTPPECLTATNLTESWRMDHNGSNIKPGGVNSFGGYACDIHQDLQWFRFTGAAGNRMLNKCPPELSCGTVVPHWTDEDVPTAVGVAATINVYGSLKGSSSCKYLTKKFEVMRCSVDTANDHIYRFLGPYYDICFEAFCGMI